MGNMEVTKEEMLALAIKCIGNQEIGCCKKMDCSRCPYNISLYTEDPKIVMSLMARAKMIWPNTKEAQDRSSLHTMLFIIVAIVMWILGAWLFGDELKINMDEQLDYAWVIERSGMDMSALGWRDFWIELKYDNARKHGAMPSIVGALGKVQENLRDVNGDGKINCIDFAVVFYEWMPCSFILYIQNGSINHLFNGHAEFKMNFVLPYWYRDLIWVEPQAVTQLYNPNKIWGDNKDWNELKVVHTNKYYKYATNIQWEWNKDKTGWRWKK